MKINNYVWENDLSLNDLVLKQKEEIERLKKAEKEALDTLESATYENINLTNEVDRLNNIINELEKWLKYKKEALEEFDLGKRKETGAFWYTTTGEIEELLIKLQELKGDGSND